MAKCVWCGEKGLFLSVNRDGLCKQCAFKIITEAQNRIRIINDCGKLVEESHNINTIVSRRDLAIEHLKFLIPYEEKGIPILNRKLNELIKDFADNSNEKIVFSLHDKFQDTILKSKQVKSENAKLKAYDKFISEADEKVKCLSEEGSSYEVSIDAINRLKEGINELKYKIANYPGELGN